MSLILGTGSRAFAVGEDTTSTAMVDADGIALAAIQGLYRQNRALQRQSLSGRDGRASKSR